MEINEMVNMILNSSVSVMVIAYFMYRDYKFMGSLQTTLTSLVETVGMLKDLMANDLVKGGEKNE